MNKFYKRIQFLLICAILTLGSTSYGQVGQYDVRFNMNNYNCQTQELFIDIEVKAHSPQTEFLISDQNYRFSFNRSTVPAINPPIGAGQTNPADRSFFIQEELTLSAFVAEGSSNSFYSPHTLTGSIDTITSYNVTLAGGTGYPVTYDQWTSVGRLRVDVIDESECLSFIWHTHDPVDFPPTFIGEKFQGVLFEADEGNYENFSICLSELCSSSLPVELAYFEGYSNDCDILLEWETETEEENSYFSVQRSRDGNEFKEIGRVIGNGTSQERHFYSFQTEATTYLEYYRLIQVDFDGTTNSSAIVVLENDCFDPNGIGGITGIYPNPVGDGDVQVKFSINKNITQGFISVSDVTGREVAIEPVEIQPGVNIRSFSTNNLVPGAYFVTIKGEGWYSDAFKLIKTSY